MATNQDLAEVHRVLNETITATRANSNLSADGKKRLIAAAYLKADTASERLHAQVAEANATARKRVESRLFGMNQFDAKDSATVMSYRDAADRASRVKSEADATALLRSAALMGDKVMQRALLGAAFQNGFQGVVDEYVTHRPDDIEDIDELIGLNAGESGATSRAGRIYGEMSRNVPKPTELADVSNQMKLQQLAAEAGDVVETPPPPNYPGPGATSGLDLVRLVGGFDMATGERNAD